MPNASIKKIIPCKKNDLIKMILDIEKYPEFVPWCLNGKIHKINDMDDIVEIEADLTVGKKFLNQTYKSLSLIHISEPTRLLSISYSVVGF